MLERLRASGGKSERYGASRPARASRPQKAARQQKPAGEGFWHQPSLLNLCADVLIIAASVALAWTAVIALQRLPFYPLREVRVLGELSQVQKSQIESAARGVVQGNFFTVNIDAARAAFEKLAWVRRVEVRRQWPDRLELRIEEHVPVARWRGIDDEPRLVNSYGEVFAGSIDLPLPMFSGPEGSSAEVLARYKQFEKALARINLHPRAVALSAREAWQVRLDNGLLLDLGRDQAKLPLAERVARFTEYYPNAIKRSQAQIVAVDMRYPNGFTLRPARNG
ncbi:MAG: cell division protein FtsQ/DivIB [Rhodocyclaceae bacterium]|nr:cell division protein FtsQ/DivIB [Rhodocyclaceae bacterium]